MKYSVVVPCYNEEKNIQNLTERFIKVNKQLSPNGFELILVNNGSKDHTEEEIDKCIQKFDFIQKVVVNTNKGYGYGVLQGMKACKGDYIGWIHADLQFDPKYFLTISCLLREKGYGERLFVKGLRKKRPLLDSFFTLGMSCLETLYLHTGLWDINAQPTMMHKNLLAKAENPPYGFSLDLYFYYLAKINKYQIIRFPAIQKERQEGKSTWNTGMKAKLKLIKRTLRDSREMKLSIRKETKKEKT